MIKYENVIKRYDNVLALDCLSFEVKENEVIGLLGPNGAGKTTTIKALIGLHSIDEGEISVFGLKQDGKNKDIRRQIGLVTQEVTVYEELTARENLAFFGGLYGLKGETLKQRINEVALLIGLDARLDDRPKKYSGGMKRRLNIGCALLHQPKLLIMDEPTVGIDPQSRNHILEFVRQIAKAGTTVIYTSHYIEEVEAVADRVFIMDQGHIIASGTINELISRVSDEEHILIEVARPTEDTAKKMASLADVKEAVLDGNTYRIILESGVDNLDLLLSLIANQGMKNLTQKKPDLEDVFLLMTGKQLRDGGGENAH